MTIRSDDLGGRDFEPDPFEVGPLDEPSIEDYPRKRPETATRDEYGRQKFDAFGAPIKEPVTVVDGVRDTRRK